MSDGQTGDRLRSLGRQLTAAHDHHRAQLEGLREDPTGTAPDRVLGTHCLAFCAALTAHHEGEDAVVFPGLEEQFPELAGVIAQLREDHQVMAGLIAALEAAVAALPADPDEAAVLRFRQQLDGLGAIMESHFRYEERRITVALDAWPDPPPAAAASLQPHVTR